MAITFLTDINVPTKTLYVDTINDRVGLGSAAVPNGPQTLLHVEKGGITPAFTAPGSEVVRVQSKEQSELSGNPTASDINIFTDSSGSGGGYSRIIFTDDQCSYGENGLYYDHANRYFSIVNKGATVATATATKSFYCGENHTIGTNDYAFAANDGNTPSGDRSFAAGHLTEATGNISTAFGYDTLASGAASFTSGALTTASGDNSFAAGGGSTASGNESAAFGFETTASGEESFAIGNGTTASGASSFAGGGPTTLASGSNAFAFGADVDVTGSHSAAFGRLHDVAGNENLVGGVSNVVNGSGNLVGGGNSDLLSTSNNLVAGGSHSFGSSTGDYNTVIGFSNECLNGSYSFVGGQEAYNFGTRSISFGSGTTASLGNQQYAFGEGTTTPVFAGFGAMASNQFVVGKYNVTNIPSLFAVGNGSSNSTRSNAFTVNTSGNVGIGSINPARKLHVAGDTEITGDLYLGRYIFHDNDTNTWIGFPTNDTISFRTNSSDRVYINSSGNVGIGTNNPSPISSNITTLDIQGSGGGGIRVGATEGVEANFYTFDNGSTIAAYAGTISSIPFHLSTANTIRATILANGNFGIGDTSPSEKLEVNGTVKASATTDAYKGYIKQNVISYGAEKVESTNYYFTAYNTTSTSTSAQAYNRIVAAYDGRVKKVYVRHAGGSTPTANKVNFKKHTNGTTSTTVYTATVANAASANMSAYYEFANSDFTFNAGDLIGLLYQTTDAFGTASKTMGGVAITITLEYNIT